MSKIKILLSGPRGNDLKNYVNAVNNAGAIAVLNSFDEDNADCDGLLLCGGSDIDPKYYNEQINGAIGIDAERDTVEFALMEKYVSEGKPVFGICRGHQLVNVFFGGSLYQHLPESDMHRGTTHEVIADANSIVGKLYGTSFVTNSTHHQAVKTPGNGLRVTAYWEGKYAESCEHTSLSVFSVQWHPERMCDGQGGEKIFEYFVKLCKQDKIR